MKKLMGDPKFAAKEWMSAHPKEVGGPHVKRCMVEESTKGMIKSKTWASCDSVGVGLPNVFRLNGKVCCPTDDYVNFGGANRDV